jgi:hypothetical protein
VIFGITGHQILPRAAVTLAVRHWTHALPAGSQLRGVSSLAAGADQLFAAHVLRVGGRLEVIEPASRYARSLATHAARKRYRRLRQAADDVITLPYPRPDRKAFLAAGLIVVERCDHLLAVWDGRCARGLGGTADIVAYARLRGREVTIVWPDGLTRA